jgi:DNA modification methylase
VTDLPGLTAEQIAAATRVVGIDTIRPHPRNPNRGSIPTVRESLRAHGQYRTIVVQQATGHVLAGNTTWAAAKAEGRPTIAIIELDVDDADDQILADILAGLPDLEGTGWNPADLDALEADIRAAEPLPPLPADPDDAPPLPAEPVTRAGDVWHLGPHRLLCGDATSRVDVTRLLDGDRCDVMVTDPPYGVAYQSATRKNAISGDLTQALIPISFAVAIEQALTDDARIYLFGGSGNWSMYAKLFDHHLRMEVRPIVWDKGHFVLRPNGYHSQFEMVYFGWRGTGGGPSHWYGDRKASDVWQVHRDPNADRTHPTQKPVEVCAIPIRYSCPPSGLVYEPFAGSGSTLIAATLEGRTCRALELDPAYCDVICRRFQILTGTVPQRVEDGRPVEYDFR